MGPDSGSSTDILPACGGGGAGPAFRAMLRVTALHLYPVKSCQGLAVPAAEVDARGFVGDRRFLVVDPAGQFLTQRQHPRMARIGTALTADSLVLSAAGHGSVAVPRTAPPAPAMAATVWKDTVQADDCGAEAAAWLTQVLGLPCRLVRAGLPYSRPIPARKIPASLAGRGDAHEVSFADGFPFLLITQASLDELNGRLEQPVPMDRFRPNLVVSGAEPFAEDGWARFRIGPVVFHGATRCGRCILTTTDQRTGERASPEPLRTLSTYRRDAEGAVLFGRNVVHETKAGRVAVGDSVELL